MSLRSEIDAVRRCVDEPTRAELDNIDRIIAMMPTLAVIDSAPLKYADDANDGAWQDWKDRMSADATRYDFITPIAPSIGPLQRPYIVDSRDYPRGYPVRP